MLRGFFLPLSESIHPTAVGNFLYLLGSSQLIEILAQARALGAMPPCKSIVAFNPPPQFAGDRLAISMDISLLVRQHMPDRHQEFASYRDHRLLFAQSSDLVAQRALSNEDGVRERSRQPQPSRHAGRLGPSFVILPPRWTCPEA
jgi:hypothetical protein